MTLEELISGCKKKDAKAQEIIYRNYSPKLFAVCLKYSKSYTEAEDNLQDAFVTIFNRIEQFEGKGSFEGWMKRIAVNTVLQKYRKQQTYSLTKEEQIEEDVDLEIVDRDVPLDYLLKIIQELPDKYRLVFTMYVLDDYPHKEISEMLGISEGTSKSNLSRARRILINKIEAYQGKASNPNLEL